jgi:hypothetical protein
MYNEYYTGRPNIFIQFIIHSLLKLNDNGLLAFVIPETFLNCQYYHLTRKYIKEHFKIIDIYKNPDTFKLTKYSTISIIIQKIKDTQSLNNKWFYNDVIIYNNEIKELLHLSHKTLNDFNVLLSVGNFVWNQHKDDITIKNDKNDVISKDSFIPLILKPNTKTIKFVKNENNKYDSIIKRNPCIIINRGYGMNYNFTFEFIDESLIKDKYPNGFILENHIICIESDIETLTYLNKSFNNPLTQKFINLFITNGALSIKELKEHIILIC